MKVENSQDAFTVCMVRFQRREWKQAGSAMSAGKQSHYVHHKLVEIALPNILSQACQKRHTQRKQKNN